MSTAEPKAITRKRPASQAESVGGTGQRLVEQVADHHHPLRDLFKNGAWWAWVASLTLHFAVLICAATVFFSSEEKVDFQTVLDFQEGDEIGLGPEIDTQIMELESVEVTSSVPVFGISDPVMQPINLGVSSVSDSGSAPAAGGNEGDPGRVSEIDQRVAAGGGSTAGNLRISLAWEDMNDIDLHVLTPDDESIYFANVRSDCGAELDVDANVVPTTRTPVENIVWSVPPRDGTYEVGIHHYTQHPNQPATTKCDILIVVGEEKRILTVRALRPGQFVEVVSFQIRDGQLAEFSPSVRVREGGGSNVAQGGPVEDEKREANRRQFAQEALADAMEQEEPRVRAARLQRLIDRFPGTPAADEAAERLREIESM